jgi:Cu/Ag efflux protein CusF
MKRALVSSALLSALVLLASLPAMAAGKKPITDKETTTVKVTIEAIDHDTRMITVKDDDGNLEDIFAGPEIRRFDELKVGDKVTFKVNESVVYQIRKPGEPVPPSKADSPAVVRNTTAKPSGTLTQQATATVTVKAVDTKKPSLTFTTEDGRTMSAKVHDKGRLKGLNPGDRIVISYTMALAVSVE